MTPAEFGALLRDRRTRLGFSLRYIEGAIPGLSRSALARIEAGEDPGIVDLLGLLDVLRGDLWAIKWLPVPRVGHLERETL